MRRADLAEPVRQRLARLPPPDDAHYGVLPGPPPQDAVQLGDVTAKLAAASRAIGRAEAMAAGLGQPWRLTRIIVRREAVASSAIEDTHSTLDELLAADVSPDDAPAPTTQALDYALALEEVVPEIKDAGPDGLTVQLIQRLHMATMRSDRRYRYQPGDLRQHSVRIGGASFADSTFNPPPADRVPACLAEHVAYLQCHGEQSMTQHLVTRMAIAHAHFEAVHPFPDGNGRVGRLLLPLMMAADETVPLYVSPYLERERPRYYDGLRRAQQRLDYAPLVELLADAIVATVDDAARVNSALVELQTSWRARRAWRKGSAAARALDVLPWLPVVTVERLASELHVTFAAANRAVVKLVEAGVLTRRTAYRRNRIFAAAEALEIINATDRAG